MRGLYGFEAQLGCFTLGAVAVILAGLGVVRLWQSLF